MVLCVLQLKAKERAHHTHKILRAFKKIYNNQNVLLLLQKMFWNEKICNIFWTTVICTKLKKKQQK